MHFHKQNLNTAQPKKEHWTAGRCWWNNGQIAQLEWQAPARTGPSFELRFNYHDHAFQIHLSFFLLSLWLSTDNSRLYRFLEPFTKRSDQKYTNGRTVGCYFFERALWVNLWDDPMESRSTDPKWWSFSIHFDDLLLGRSAYSVETLDQGEAEIDMPEGKYPTTYTVERRTWKRPRWPWPVIDTSVQFEITAGIPHEGKGDNDWDQGMNSTHGIGTHWDGNIYDAARRVALKCLATRQKYGSLSSLDYQKWYDRRVHLGALKKQAQEIMNAKARLG